MHEHVQVQVNFKLITIAIEKFPRKLTAVYIDDRLLKIDKIFCLDSHNHERDSFLLN